MMRVRGLNVSYGAVGAVRDVSLEVPRGRVVALIGSNGAGKTSTLKAISGLLRASSGSIEIDGQAVERMPAFRIARLGLRHVPEGGGVFSRMSVEDNLLTGLPYGRPVQASLDPIYQRFPILAERRLQKGGLLSGGERQMLALGRALISSPAYLLLDEPSLGLAPKMIDTVFRMVAQLRADGLGVLLVEQNAVRALEIADHAYVIEVGAIALEGSGAQVMQDPSVIDRYLGTGSETQAQAVPG